MESRSSAPARRAARILVLLVPPLLAAALAFFQVVNGDIGFHVATGRYIDLAGRLPDSNVLSFAEGEHPWVLHQFLPAWLFHRIEVSLGRDMLVAVKAILVYLTFLFLWDGIMRRQKRLPGAPLDALAMGGWLLAVAAGAAACRFFIRPFLFSSLGLAVVLALLSRYENDRRPVRLVQIALVTGAFAPLHAGVIYILLTLLAFAAGTAASWGVSLWRGRRGSSDSRPGPFPFPWAPVLVLPAAVVAAAVALLLSDPSGLQALTLPFRFSVHPYFHEHLAEFRPFPFDPLQYPFAWGLVGLTVVMGAGVVLRRAGGRSDSSAPSTSLGAGTSGKSIQGTGVFEALLLGGFTLLLLRHQRMVFEYALVAAFVLARWVGELRKGPGGEKSQEPEAAGRTIPIPMPPRSPAGGAALRNLLLLSAAMLSAGAIAQQYSTARFGLGVDNRFYPDRLFSFVRQHDLPDPAYVSDAWGGHWLWEFYPERKVFYDNRLEAYSFEFFRDVYQSIRYGEPGWQEKLDAYGIRMLVLRHTTPGERKFQQGRPNIRDLAFASPDWELVFWDDLGMIYLRNPSASASASASVSQSQSQSQSASVSPSPLPCSGCFRFTRLNPDTLVPVNGWDDPELGRELRQAFALAPGERSGYALAAWLARRDRVAEAAEVLTEALRLVPESGLLEGLVREIAVGGE